MRGSFHLLGLGLLLSAPALADEPLVLRAMQDELAREKAELRLPEIEAPYYIEYTVVDASSLRVRAAYGALLSSEPATQRFSQVGLRVGDPAFDQSNYGSPGISGQLYQIAFEDDYDLIRHELWLTTDEAYKSAVELLAYKRAELETRLEKPDQPSFSSAPPVVLVAPEAAPLSVDRAAWESLARAVSAVFLKYPELQDAKVEVAAWLDERYYTNTEGSRVYQTRLLARVYLSAETRGEDGIKQRDAVPLYYANLTALPSQAELEKKAAAFADALLARRAAKPLEEDYIGPVLFEGEAAAQVVRKILADRLTATPPPGLAGVKLGPSGRADFSSKLGRKVLPKFLSVEDDPTRATFGGVPLLGAYAVDEEGAKAQRVSLVEKGILTGLLASRTPSKAGPLTNGHGRGSLVSAPKGRPGNLFVRADKGLSSKELRKRAAQLAKEAGLPYAIVVSRLETPGSFDMDAPSATDETVPPPLVASRIYPDGREEPLRGLSLAEVDLRSLQRVVAAGSEAAVYSFLANGDAGGFHGFLADEQPTFAIPMSIIAPALLFEEVEAKKLQADPPKPPILRDPLFAP